MSATEIIYEHPLNERMRTFLRLDFLFQQTAQNDLGNEASQRQMLAYLFELLEICDRGELKGDLTKELGRLYESLAAMRNNPNVNHGVLDTLLNNITRHITNIRQDTKQFGDQLRALDFIHAIRQRSNLAGGTSAMDLPTYHHWLNQTDTAARQQQIIAWRDVFLTLQSAIDDYLSLLRNSPQPILHIAEKGLYQQQLTGVVPHQLLRISLPANAPYYPEISGNKHRFNIRFMTFSVTNKPTQENVDVAFSLTACAL